MGWIRFFFFFLTHHSRLIEKNSSTQSIGTLKFSNQKKPPVSMINVDQIITANLEECEIGIIPSFELPIEEEKKILLRSNHQLSHA